MALDRPATTDGASRSCSWAPARAGSGASAAAARMAGNNQRPSVTICRMKRWSPSGDSGNKAFAHERRDIRDRHARRGGIAPRLVFDLAFLQAAVANRNAVRDADQLQI